MKIIDFISLIFLLIPFVHVLILKKYLEFIFFFWAVLYLIILFFFSFNQSAIRIIQSIHYFDLFKIFAIMLIFTHEKILGLIPRIPIKPSVPLFFFTLAILPLFGSIISEPAVMIICSAIICHYFNSKSHSLNFKYSTMALLFINISIGGSLTTFSAPPILMVAKTFHWDFPFMIEHFAFKTLCSTIINTLSVIIFYYKEDFKSFNKNEFHINHVTKFELLQVIMFLVAIEIIGEPQAWWITRLISPLKQIQLYLASVSLTSFIDNAALTFLASKANITNVHMQLAVVKGSLVGGGLTVIANAPNLIGYHILKKKWKIKSFSSKRLFILSLPLTTITAIIFYL